MGRVYIVALTGGIGCGKTTATNYFAQLGVPIIDTDLLAREVVLPSNSLLSKIVQHFGQSILLNGELNRAALRNIIFENPDEKKWLEALLHPAIDQLIQEEIAKINYPYCIVVIPLLTEHFERYRPWIDHVLVVDATEEQQISRAQARDPNYPLLSKMIQAQASRESRLKIADTVISNSGSISELKSQILNFHNRLVLKP
ncbi:MAG: dephospho-CoA kinase [Candidatus Berkiellales bacterium]